MKIYIVLAYDEDWYTFESYLGAFRTKEEAQNFIDNDYWTTDEGEKVVEHEEYIIKEEEI